MRPHARPGAPLARRVANGVRPCPACPRRPTPAVCAAVIDALSLGRDTSMLSSGGGNPWEDTSEIEEAVKQQAQVQGLNSTWKRAQDMTFPEVRREGAHPPTLARPRLPSA